MTNKETYLELYKLAVEMADRVSQRRQTANSFYLSVNAAILTATSFVSHDILLSVAGFLTCIFWMQNIKSYKDLNSGKFHVITDMEEKLPYALYKTEWDFLERGKNSKKYKPFHKVEIFVPCIFMLVYAAMIFIWAKNSGVYSYIGWIICLICRSTN